MDCLRSPTRSSPAGASPEAAGISPAPRSSAPRRRLAEQVHEVALHAARVLELVHEQRFHRASHRAAHLGEVHQRAPGLAQQIPERERALPPTRRAEARADVAQQRTGGALHALQAKPMLKARREGDGAVVVRRFSKLFAHLHEPLVGRSELAWLARRQQRDERRDRLRGEQRTPRAHVFGQVRQQLPRGRAERLVTARREVPRARAPRAVQREGVGVVVGTREVSRVDAFFVEALEQPRQQLARLRHPRPPRRPARAPLPRAHRPRSTLRRGPRRSRLRRAVGRRPRPAPARLGAIPAHTRCRGRWSRPRRAACRCARGPIARGPAPRAASRSPCRA
jgi:hypothetical protein